MMYLTSPWVWLFLLLNYAFLDYIYLGMKPGYEHGYIRFLRFLFSILKKQKPKDLENSAFNSDFILKQGSKPEFRSTTFVGDSTMTFEEFSRQRAEVAKNERLNFEDKENEIRKYKSWRDGVYLIIPILVFLNCGLSYAYAEEQFLRENILKENSVDQKQKSPPILNSADKKGKKNEQELEAK